MPKLTMQFDSSGNIRASYDGVKISKLGLLNVGRKYKIGSRNTDARISGSNTTKDIGASNAGMSVVNRSKFDQLMNERLSHMTPKSPKARTIYPAPNLDLPKMLNEIDMPKPYPIERPIEHPLMSASTGGEEEMNNVEKKDTLSVKSLSLGDLDLFGASSKTPSNDESNEVMSNISEEVDESDNLDESDESSNLDESDESSNLDESSEQDDMGGDNYIIQSLELSPIKGEEDALINAEDVPTEIEPLPRHYTVKDASTDSTISSNSDENQPTQMAVESPSNSEEISPTQMAVENTSGDIAKGEEISSKQMAVENAPSNITEGVNTLFTEIPSIQMVMENQPDDIVEDEEIQSTQMAVETQSDTIVKDNETPSILGEVSPTQMAVEPSSNSVGNKLTQMAVESPSNSDEIQPTQMAVEIPSNSEEIPSTQMTVENVSADITEGVNTLSTEVPSTQMAAEIPSNSVGNQLAQMAVEPPSNFVGNQPTQVAVETPSNSVEIPSTQVAVETQPTQMAVEIPSTQVAVETQPTQMAVEIPSNSVEIPSIETGIQPAQMVMEIPSISLLGTAITQPHINTESMPIGVYKERVENSQPEQRDKGNEYIVSAENNKKIGEITDVQKPVESGQKSSLSGNNFVAFNPSISGNSRSLEYTNAQKELQPSDNAILGGDVNVAKSESKPPIVKFDITKIKRRNPIVRNTSKKVVNSMAGMGVDLETLKRKSPARRSAASTGTKTTKKATTAKKAIAATTSEEVNTTKRVRTTKKATPVREAPIMEETMNTPVEEVQSTPASVIGESTFESNQPASFIQENEKENEPMNEVNEQSIEQATAQPTEQPAPSIPSIDLSSAAAPAQDIPSLNLSDAQATATEPAPEAPTAPAPETSVPAEEAPIDLASSVPVPKPTADTVLEILAYDKFLENNHIAHKALFDWLKLSVPKKANYPAMVLQSKGDNPFYLYGLKFGARGGLHAIIGYSTTITAISLNLDSGKYSSDTLRASNKFIMFGDDVVYIPSMATAAKIEV